MKQILRSKSISEGDSGEALWKAQTSNFIEKLDLKYSLNEPWSIKKIGLFIDTFRDFLKENPGFEFDFEATSLLLEYWSYELPRIHKIFESALEGGVFETNDDEDYLRKAHEESKRKLLIGEAKFQSFKNTFNSFAEDADPDSFIAFIEIHRMIKSETSLFFPLLKSFQNDSAINEKWDKDLMTNSFNFEFKFTFQGKNFLKIKFTLPNIDIPISGTFLDFNIDDKENLIIP